MPHVVESLLTWACSRHFCDLLNVGGLEKELLWLLGRTVSQRLGTQALSKAGACCGCTRDVATWTEPSFVWQSGQSYRGWGIEATCAPPLEAFAPWWPPGELRLPRMVSWRFSEVPTSDHNDGQLSGAYVLLQSHEHGYF